MEERALMLSLTDPELEVPSDEVKTATSSSSDADDADLRVDPRFRSTYDTRIEVESLVDDEALVDMAASLNCDPSKLLLSRTESLMVDEIAEV
jgi:hypothetical protein